MLAAIRQWAQVGAHCAGWRRPNSRSDSSSSAVSPPCTPAAAMRRRSSAPAPPRIALQRLPRVALQMCKLSRHPELDMHLCKLLLYTAAAHSCSCSSCKRFVLCEGQLCSVPSLLYWPRTAHNPFSLASRIQGKHQLTRLAFLAICGQSGARFPVLTKGQAPAQVPGPAQRPDTLGHNPRCYLTPWLQGGYEIMAHPDPPGSALPARGRHEGSAAAPAPCTARLRHQEACGAQGPQFPRHSCTAHGSTVCHQRRVSPACLACCNSVVNALAAGPAPPATALKAFTMELVIKMVRL